MLSFVGSVEGNKQLEATTLLRAFEERSLCCPFESLCNRLKSCLSSLPRSLKLISCRSQACWWIRIPRGAYIIGIVVWPQFSNSSTVLGIFSRSSASIQNLRSELGLWCFVIAGKGVAKVLPQPYKLEPTQSPLKASKKWDPPK